MGWADMLIQMGIPYNSDKAIELAERSWASFRERARTLGSPCRERGVFPITREYL